MNQTLKNHPILWKALSKSGVPPCGECDLCRKAIELNDHRPAIGCHQRYSRHFAKEIHFSDPNTGTSDTLPNLFRNRKFDTGSSEIRYNRSRRKIDETR